MKASALTVRDRLLAAVGVGVILFGIIFGLWQTQEHERREEVRHCQNVVAGYALGVSFADSLLDQQIEPPKSLRESLRRYAPGLAECDAANLRRIELEYGTQRLVFADSDEPPEMRA